MVLKDYFAFWWSHFWLVCIPVPNAPGGGGGVCSFLCMLGSHYIDPTLLKYVRWSVKWTVVFFLVKWMCSLCGALGVTGLYLVWMPAIQPSPLTLQNHRGYLCSYPMALPEYPLLWISQELVVIGCCCFLVSFLSFLVKIPPPPKKMNQRKWESYANRVRWPGYQVDPTLVNQCMWYTVKIYFILFKCKHTTLIWLVCIPFVQWMPLGAGVCSCLWMPGNQ